jgi:hypothetical protein
MARQIPAVFAAWNFFVGREKILQSGCNGKECGQKCFAARRTIGRKNKFRPANL